MISVDPSALRDRERSAALELVAALDTDADSNRAISVAATSGGDRCVVAGRAVDIATVFGARAAELEGPVAPELLITRVPRRVQLAGELTRRLRGRSALLVRHWQPEAGAVLLVLCTPAGVAVTSARRQLGAERAR